VTDETKTITFDLDYQGLRYSSRKAVFGRTESGLLMSLSGPMVELTAEEAEHLGVSLIAGAEALRRGVR